MKSHIVLSEEILTGNVSEELLRIAVRHHEKLDGSGYPRGLSGDAMTRNERLMAVADIMSALFGVRSYKKAMSRERVMQILGDMGRRGLIDAGMVALVGDSYDVVLKEVGESSRKITGQYDALRQEYQQARESVARDGKYGLLPFVTCQPLSCGFPA